MLSANCRVKVSWSQDITFLTPDIFEADVTTLSASFPATSISTVSPIANAAVTVLCVASLSSVLLCSATTRMAIR